MHTARRLRALLLAMALPWVNSVTAQSPDWNEVLSPRQGKPSAPAGYKVVIPQLT